MGLLLFITKDGLYCLEILMAATPHSWRFLLKVTYVV